MVSEYISELSTKPVVKRQAKTSPEVSVGSAAPSKIVGNDIRVLLKKAKKCGESPVSAYAEYIKGEVAIGLASFPRRTLMNYGTASFAATMFTVATTVLSTPCGSYMGTISVLPV